MRLTPNYARSVSILIRRSLNFIVLEVRTDPDGRYVILYASIYDK